MGIMMRGCLLLVFLLCSANGDIPGVPAEPGDWMIMIISLTRHGQRAAQTDPFITAAAESVFWRGAGELSAEGVEDARAVGKAYRDAYATNNFSFIDPRYNPNEVHFRASAIDRVLMTSSAMSSALFEEQGREIQAATYTVPYANDTLLGINADCTLGWDDVKQKYNLVNTSDMGGQLLSQMRAREWNCVDPPSSQSDTLLSESANQQTKEELNDLQIACANDEAQKFMFEYVQTLGGSGTNDTDARMRLQRTIGNLANEIVDSMKKKVDCYADLPRFCDPYVGSVQMYTAHDVNIVTLLNVFTLQRGSRDFFQNRNPSFACSVSMELWMHFGSPYVKIFIRNGQDFQEFLFCDYLGDVERVGRYCTLNSLESAKNLSISREQPPCMPDSNDNEPSL